MNVRDQEIRAQAWSDGYEAGRAQNALATFFAGCMSGVLASALCVWWF